MTRHNDKTDLVDRLRTAAAVAGSTGQVIEMDGFRRVRRWDEPQTPDPYPERPHRDHGVRQRDRHNHGGDWESMNGLPVTEPVVDPATPQPDWMTTAGPGPTEHRPFVAAPPEPIARRAPRLTWWAVGLSVVAQSTVAAAIHWGSADPVTAAVVSLAMLMCSLLLIAAEQMTGRSGQ